MDRDSHRFNIKLPKKITILDDEIARFDALLEGLQERFPEEYEIYERIVYVRDGLYRLKAQMRDCVIEEFDSGGLVTSSNGRFD